MNENVNGRLKYVYLLFECMSISISVQLKDSFFILQGTLDKPMKNGFKFDK